MAANNGGRTLLRRAVMIHEPTDEVHRETVIFNDLIVVYTLHRDALGLGVVRKGEHVETKPNDVRRLLLKLPDLQRQVNLCTCPNHRDYRMEIEYAVET